MDFINFIHYRNFFIWDTVIHKIEFHTLSHDKAFTPAEIREGDECFVNGIFEFNITRMILSIE